MDYTITIKFSADRELTEEELHGLRATVWAQVAEPQVSSEDGWEDAEYETSDISIATENK
jgi:hypothetical protein